MLTIRNSLLASARRFAAANLWAGPLSHVIQRNAGTKVDKANDKVREIIFLVSMEEVGRSVHELHLQLPHIFSSQTPSAQIQLPNSLPGYCRELPTFSKHHLCCVLWEGHRNENLLEIFGKSSACYSSPLQPQSLQSHHFQVLQEEHAGKDLLRLLHAMRPCGHHHRHPQSHKCHLQVFSQTIQTLASPSLALQPHAP